METYFQKLFKSEIGDMGAVLSCVQEKVMVVDNYEIEKTFTREKVRRELFSMHPNKAPSEDGLNLEFFKNVGRSLGIP